MTQQEKNRQFFIENKNKSIDELNHILKNDNLSEQQKLAIRFLIHMNRIKQNIRNTSKQ